MKTLGAIALAATSMMIVVAGLAAAQTGPASTQNWLSGAWRAKVANPNKGYYAIYEIRVPSIGADGALTVEWDTIGKYTAFGNGKFVGATLTLSFLNGNVTTLQRDASGNLVGGTAFADGRDTHKMTFVKFSTDTEAPAAGSGCETFAPGHGRAHATFSNWHLNDGDKNSGPVWFGDQVIDSGGIVCRHGRLVKAD